MRTIPFKTALHGVCHMKGVDPTKDLTPELALVFSQFITNRYIEIYKHAFWPELMVIEERAYRQTHVPASEYLEDDEVYSDVQDKYYIAAQDVPGGTAITNTTYWTELTAFNRYVPFIPPAGTSGLNIIAQAANMSRRDPRKTTGPGYIKFWLSRDGVQAPPEAGTTVWLEFRPPPPRFNSTLWNTTSAYIAGDVRYLSATGECYVALVPNSNQNPVTTTGIWQKVDFYADFELFVTRAAFADALIDDGQMEKAEAIMGETDNPRPGTAYNELQNVYDVAITQQGQYMTAQR